MVAHRYSAKTSQAYAMWIRQLRDYCGENTEDIQVDTVIEFLDRQTRRGLKSESIRQAIAALKFYYRNISKRPDIISVLPTIKPTRAEKYIPERDEIIEIIRHVKDPELRLSFYLIYGIGLELGEALRLRAGALSATTQTLTFKTQRKKQRSTIVPKLIAEDINKLASQRAHNELLFQHKGREISKSTAQRSWNRARQLAHARLNIDIRSLRHAYIHHLTRNGYSLQDVLAHLKLNSPGVLDYYSKYMIVRGVTVSPLDINSDNNHNQLAIFPYVAEDRIADLMRVESGSFDLSRILSVLRELNECARSGNLHAVALLLRMLIDHTAPVFGVNSFQEVVNNIPLPRSLKNNLELLNKGLRNIADLYLHDHISARVTLPTVVQVDFRHALDQYLGLLTKHLREGSA
jgi:site-specific recombinase XerD